MTVLVSVLLGVLGGGMLGAFVAMRCDEGIVRAAKARIRELERDLRTEQHRNRLFYRATPVEFLTLDALCGRETYTEETEQS